eukprot:TRINITY_DN36680_c0_g1_i1.p1 TRINITY_DN36680_c0_g1~~TRINITY_DN36680_c0_g1_i1.p1  ORF type:complete len:412 (+),score=126.65 TRINITY_DN36680_c0_g1_i1:65-1237(+)
MPGGAEGRGRAAGSPSPRRPRAAETPLLPAPKRRRQDQPSRKLLGPMREKLVAAATGLDLKAHDGAFTTPLSQLRTLVKWNNVDVPYPPHPMNIQTIRDRAKTVYTSPDELLADVELMHRNVASFCGGKNSPVGHYVTWAAQVMRMARRKVDVIRTELAPLEAANWEEAVALHRTAEKRLQKHPLAPNVTATPPVRPDSPDPSPPATPVASPAPSHPSEPADRPQTPPAEPTELVLAPVWMPDRLQRRLRRQLAPRPGDPPQDELPSKWTVEAILIDFLRAEYPSDEQEPPAEVVDARLLCAGILRAADASVPTLLLPSEQSAHSPALLQDKPGWGSVYGRGVLLRLLCTLPRRMAAVLHRGNGAFLPDAYTVLQRLNYHLAAHWREYGR